MTSNPEISVIIANFNHAQFIEFALTSVLNQTFENFEVLIVDDGSKDNSREIIEKIAKLDSRIREPIFLPENKGKWFALNTACYAARGKLITQNDADDASNKYRLERQYRALMETKSFHNLCGFTHCHSDKDMAEALRWEPNSLGYDIMQPEEVTRKVLDGYKTSGINHYFVGNDYEIHGASALYYKQLWNFGMKYMPGDMGLRCQLAEDGDHNTKMTLLLQKTTVLKEPLYCYRRGTATNDAYLRGL